MKKITKYEIIAHGFENHQYFQGCGISFTEFDDIATGCGNTAQEAFEDACESLAQNDWDTSTIKGKRRLSRQTVKGYLRAQGEPLQDGEDCEMYAYVSIRVK